MILAKERLDAYDKSDELNVISRAVREETGAAFAVVMTFTRPGKTSEWDLDIGAAGSGPAGFSEVLRRMMHLAADALADGVRQTEAAASGKGEA